MHVALQIVDSLSCVCLSTFGLLVVYLWSTSGLLVVYLWSTCGLLVIYLRSSSATDCHRLPHTATDWLKCFCIYRLKWPKAVSGWDGIWMEISVSTSSESTFCAANNNLRYPPFFPLKLKTQNFGQFPIQLAVGQWQRIFHRY